MSNIREVAKLAGVSTATVSRFLSSPDKLSAKSAAKVRAAVAQLNYHPNLLARNFSKSRAYAVLVLVPDIANPFFSRVIRGIEYAGQQKGYAVLLGDTRYSADKERSYVDLARSRQADGIIQLSYTLPFALDSQGQPPLPFVQACECASDARYPTVQVDNAAAAQMAVDHLLELGHRRIACVSGPTHSPLTRDRLRGYRASMARAGQAVDPGWLVPGDFSMHAGHKAAARLLQLAQRPTAVFCMNDEMAIGLISGVRDAGLRVPDDLSVVGFDDIEYARYCDPPLSTVAQPAEHIGQTAMNYLIDLLVDGGSARRESVLPTALNVRRSSAPPSV